MLLCMSRKSTPPDRHPGHFLREWRTDRGWSLEELAERVSLIADKREQEDPFFQDRQRIGMSHGTLSRIEQGKVPYNQHLLDLLAEVYGTDPGSLIMRNPMTPDAPWSIYDEVKPMPPGLRGKIAAYIAGVKATGTDG